MSDSKTFAWLGVAALTFVTLSIQSTIPMGLGVLLTTILNWGLVYLVVRYKKTGMAWVGVALLIAADVIDDWLIAEGPSGWWHNTPSALAAVSSHLESWNLVAWALYFIGWRFLINAGKRAAPAGAPPAQIVHHIHHGLPGSAAPGLAWTASEAHPVVTGTVERPAFGGRTRQALGSADSRNAYRGDRSPGQRVLDLIARGLR